MLKNANILLETTGELSFAQDPGLSVQQRKDLVASAQQDLNENYCAKRFDMTM